MSTQYMLRCSEPGSREGPVWAGSDKRELLAVELRPSGSIAKREHESEKDRLKPLGLVENLRRSGYSQNVATHQGYTKLYLEMYPTRYGSEIIKESQHVR